MLKWLKSLFGCKGDTCCNPTLVEAFKRSPFEEIESWECEEDGTMSPSAGIGGSGGSGGSTREGNYDITPVTVYWSTLKDKKSSKKKTKKKKSKTKKKEKKSKKANKQNTKKGK